MFFFGRTIIKDSLLKIMIILMVTGMKIYHTPILLYSLYTAPPLYEREAITTASCWLLVGKRPKPDGFQTGTNHSRLLERLGRSIAVHRRLVKVEHLSNEQRAPGWLGYLWDYSTILSNYIWDSHKPLHGSFQSFE